MITGRVIARIGIGINTATAPSLAIRNIFGEMEREISFH